MYPPPSQIRFFFQIRRHPPSAVKIYPLGIRRPNCALCAYMTKLMDISKFLRESKPMDLEQITTREI